MTLQPIFSRFPCSPLVKLQAWLFFAVVFPSCFLHHFTEPWKVVLARPHEWKYGQTTAVCISLRLPGDLCLVHLPAGSWRTLPYSWPLYETGMDVMLAPHFHSLYSSLELHCDGPWFISINGMKTTITCAGKLLIGNTSLIYFKLKATSFINGNVSLGSSLTMH